MRRLLRRLKRLFGFEPPFEETAPVPRRPLAPLGRGGVALDLPDDPDDADARARGD